MPVDELGVDARGDVRRHHAAARADGRGPGASSPTIGPIIDEPIRSAGRRLAAAPASIRNRAAFTLDAIGMVRAASWTIGRRVIGFSRRAVHAGLLPHRGPAVARLRARQGVHVPRAARVARPHGASCPGRWSSPTLRAQVDAGAQVVQLFDSWVGRPRTGRLSGRTSQPHVAAGSSRPAGRADDPLRDGHGRRSWSAMADAGGTSSGSITASVAGRQPARESAGTAASRATSIRRACSPAGDGDGGGRRAVLEQAGGRPGHVFNLGHGVLPARPIRHCCAGWSTSSTSRRTRSSGMSRS